MQVAVLVTELVLGELLAMVAVVVAVPLVQLIQAVVVAMETPTAVQALLSFVTMEHKEI